MDQTDNNAGHKIIGLIVSRVSHPCDAVWSTVSRPSRVDYEVVQSVINAGTQEVGWVAQELRDADLSDKRLDRRLVKIVEHFAQSPVAPINEACGDWASTQASYRLFNNVKASPRAILQPHIQATARRMVAVQGPVLAVQDTVFFLCAAAHKKKNALHI